MKVTGYGSETRESVWVIKRGGSIRGDEETNQALSLDSMSPPPVEDKAGTKDAK